MDKFTTLTGVAAPMPLINVDTDMIIPKQFLKTIKRSGLGKNLFDEMRYDDDGNEIPDFVLNKPAYRNAQILVAGDNFGCGSSREHAPWALLDFGIRCVIAPASPTSSSTTASRTASCRSSCRRKTSTS
jgi:3-isopropylmalate/(R)-2-methylmalate dehydratase small subunit